MLNGSGYIPDNILMKPLTWQREQLRNIDVDIFRDLTNILWEKHG
jgi:hypothetical protein